jgi:hypothetical protein
MRPYVDALYGPSLALYHPYLAQYGPLLALYHLYLARYGPMYGGRHAVESGF